MKQSQWPATDFWFYETKFVERNLHNDQDNIYNLSYFLTEYLRVEITVKEIQPYKTPGYIFQFK